MRGITPKSHTTAVRDIDSECSEHVDMSFFSFSLPTIDLKYTESLSSIFR